MAEEKEIILTKIGMRALKQGLEYLKTTKRSEITEKIKVARGFGDLSENAEYDEAKNEQAEVENKMGLGLTDTERIASGRLLETMGEAVAEAGELVEETKRNGVK